MAKEHVYRLEVAWTGDRGTGTSGYTAYGREHEIRAAGKPALPGSSDPAFRGDPARWNPEELLLASLSACHMLWYLHLCADAGVVVTGYVDRAEGIMVEPSAGVARFERVILKPCVTLAPGADRERAGRLHEAAHARCFIANSVNFAVEHAPEFATAPSGIVSLGERSTAAHIGMSTRRHRPTPTYSSSVQARKHQPFAGYTDLRALRTLCKPRLAAHCRRVRLQTLDDVAVGADYYDMVAINVSFGGAQ